MIAAYALNRQATVVTDNVRHFQDMGLTTENWGQREGPSPATPET